MSKRTGFRITELDALRGIAAIAVVFFHYTSRHQQIFEFEHTYEFPYGHYGVDLFFVISGFVIFLTISHIDSGFKFVYNRIARLYPTFWTCVILTFLTTYIFGPENLERSWAEFLVNLTMIPSLLGFQMVDGAYWSLVPEIMFYAFILSLVIFNKKDRILVVGYIWILLMAIYRVPDLNIFNQVGGILNLKYGQLFLSGINFYMIFHNRKSINNHIQIFLCFLLNITTDLSLAPLISSVLIYSIFYAFVYNKLVFISVKPLIFLGKISYALYLIHQFIGYVIIEKLIKGGISSEIVLITVPLTCSILIATLITYFVEIPANNGLKKLYKRYAS